jgi:hypothetical protein
MNIPVEAGKVGVFYDPITKVISHYGTFNYKGTIVTSIPVIVADNQEALKVAIAEAQLIERQ